MRSVDEIAALPLTEREVTSLAAQSEHRATCELCANNKRSLCEAGSDLYIEVCDAVRDAIGEDLDQFACMGRLYYHHVEHACDLCRGHWAGVSFKCELGPNLMRDHDISLNHETPYGDHGDLPQHAGQAAPRREPSWGSKAKR